jgi:undecaprenyl-diphosphatase
MGHVIDWLVKLPPALVLVAVFVVPLLESSAFVGFIFPGEIAILIGGVIANEGAVPLWSVIVLGAAGAIIGDSIGYEVGKHYGEGLLTRLPNRLVKPDHIERTKDLLRRRGGRAVFIGRFTAALRVLVPGMAGMARLRYPSFLLINALGGIAWAAETAVVGYLAGKSYRAAEHRLSVIGFGLLGLIIAGYLLHRLRRHPRVAGHVDARLSTEQWTGGPLTLAIAAAGLSAWVFGGVLQDVVGHDGIALHDPHWHNVLITHRRAWLTDFAKILTYLGSTPVVYGVLILAALLAVRRHRYWEAALALAAMIVGQLIRYGISVLVARPRPPRTDWLTSASGYAFPSGHSTNAVLAWGLVVAVLWPWLAQRRHRATAIGIAVVVALIVGATRAYLGVHWPSDVLGGWALGCTLLTLSVTALSLLRFHSSPTPQHRRGQRPGTEQAAATPEQ